MMKKAIYFLMTLGFISLKGTALPEVRRFENYLNNLKTLSGDFTQINSKGQTVTGTIQIARPGKMRLTYNPPSSLLIVADGKWLITKDREADQVDYVSLENTPAAFILRPHVRFSGDVEITNIVPKNGNMTEISLIRKEEPDAGYITLVFQDNPVALKEWSIVDGQGVETRVILSSIKSNIALPAQLFVIESPNLIQQIF
ncbi:MAG: outer membrane lipoprotein carrier protein LolA [Proteobacteria bacterium]|nr:outer membrane lipoprotein carrier protein LolA [Pseudomonadota bacterium]